MYHLRLRGTHYEMGYKWGSSLLKSNKNILENVPFKITKEYYEFAQQCLPYYKKFFPQILEEIRGIADGQKIAYKELSAVLLSMYCIIPSTNCSCMAIKNHKTTLFGRNSDFLCEIEKFYMNTIYKFSNDSYSFIANTTAFVEMEDGVNEYGLAIGLTSIYPTVLEVGLNAGMLFRLFLETCKNIEEVIQTIKTVKIASSQTFTLSDASGRIALIECNAKTCEIIISEEVNTYVCATNYFHTDKMKKYNNEQHDNWFAKERYLTMTHALHRNKKNMNQKLIEEILSGKHGFLCQYDRKTGKDTVWSLIYNSASQEIFRVEGNPARIKFKKEDRFIIHHS